MSLHDIMRNMKLKPKILILSISVFILSTVTVGCLVYSYIFRRVVDISAQQTTEIIRQASEYNNQMLKYVLEQFYSLQLDNRFIEMAQNRDISMASYVENMNTADKLFSNIRIGDYSIINNIVFYRNDGKIFREYTNINNTRINVSSNFTSEDWYVLAEQSPNKNIWDVRDNGKNKEIRLMKKISYNSDDDGGVLVFFINDRFLDEQLNKINVGVHAKVLLCDNGGNVVSSSGYESLDEMNDSIVDIKDKLEQSTFTFVKDERFYTANKYNVNGWHLVLTLNLNDLVTRFDLMVYLLILITVIGVLFYSILALLLVKIIVSPINRLEKLVGKIKTGNFDVSFVVNGKDEINMLGETFNVMISDLKLLMGQIKDERESKAKLELRVLQEQVKPHFLYNTLDSIYWLCLSGNNEKSSKMVQHLSNYFRLGLNSGNDMITVKNEIEHVNSYLVIQKIRYEELFDFEIEMDESISQCYILKTLIQPLVENSIYHGLFEPKIKGKIWVKAYKENENVVIVVSDNGIGFDTEKVECLLQGERPNMYTSDKLNYGLLNVYDRIKLKYQGKGKLSFQSEIGKGTVAKIEIPSDMVELESVEDIYE